MEVQGSSSNSSSDNWQHLPHTQRSYGENFNNIVKTVGVITAVSLIVTVFIALLPTITAIALSLMTTHPHRPLDKG